MKLQQDAKAVFQNIQDEASDICYDAKKKAGIEQEEPENKEAAE